jgi:hypothetical protein
MPFRIIPERGKVSENIAKPPSKECCNVLHDDVSRSNFANKTGILAPEAGTLTGKPRAFSCDADILAGESAADGIHGNSVCCQARRCEGSNVIVARNLRPMLCENGAREWLDLAESDGLEARTLQAEGEAADAAEKVQKVHGSTSATVTPVQASGP